MKRPPTYRSLMASAGIDRLSTDEAFLRAGILIDMCGAPRRKAGIARALAWCDELEARDLTAAERGQLDYFRANAWNTRRPRRRSGDIWLWDQPAIQQEIFFLRRATGAESFAAVEHYRRCEILTNLGNLLSHLGRSIEALEIWRRALGVDPEFWMARGNLGSGLARLGRLHYDRNQGAVMLLSAHKELVRALGDAEKYPSFGFPEARVYFEQQRRDIEANVNLSAVAENFEPDGYAIGRSKRERQYRLWCLRHDLFLNLLNELGPDTVAAHDPLVLPSFVTKLGEPPVLIGYFDQLKQEFVSARWAFFEGIQDGPAHLSDNGVLLINTLDYPSYGLSAEKIRTAYRTAYSLFDKMAFFLKSLYGARTRRSGCLLSGCVASEEGEGAARDPRRACRIEKPVLPWPLLGQQGPFRRGFCRRGRSGRARFARTAYPSRAPLCEGSRADGWLGGPPGRHRRFVRRHTGLFDLALRS